MARQTIRKGVQSSRFRSEIAGSRRKQRNLGRSEPIRHSSAIGVVGQTEPGRPLGLPQGHARACPPNSTAESTSCCPIAGSSRPEDKAVLRPPQGLNRWRARWRARWRPVRRAALHQPVKAGQRRSQASTIAQIKITTAVMGAMVARRQQRLKMPRPDAHHRQRKGSRRKRHWLCEAELPGWAGVAQSVPRWPQPLKLGWTR